MQGVTCAWVSASLGCSGKKLPSPFLNDSTFLLSLLTMKKALAKRALPKFVPTTKEFSLAFHDAAYVIESVVDRWLHAKIQ